MLRTLTCVLALFAASANADPVVETVEYEIDGTAFESLLIYEGHLRAHRPGVVMVPNWLGINDTAIARAKEIAGERYIVLLADMYGKDVRPQNFDEAGKASSAVTGDRALTRVRGNRAVQALRESGQAVLRPGGLAVIGFCFGGTVALELARSGADVLGVVSFHGDPKPVEVAGKGDVKAHLLVLHGAEDPYVGADHVSAFQSEMNAAGADWTLVSYSGAKHCFAESEANNTPPGCLYHRRSAQRAYALMHTFLEERFTAEP